MNGHKRCCWVTKLNDKGFAESWCGESTEDDDHFCPTHRSNIQNGLTLDP